MAISACSGRTDPFCIDNTITRIKAGNSHALLYMIDRDAMENKAPNRATVRLQNETALIAVQPAIQLHMRVCRSHATICLQL